MKKYIQYHGTKERLGSNHAFNYTCSDYLWNSNGVAEYFFRLYTREDFARDYDRIRVRYIIETRDFISELKKIEGIKVCPSMKEQSLHGVARR